MSIAKKLQQVMAQVCYLEKDKRLTGGARYTYLSEEALTAAAHGAFVDVGLVIAPVKMEILENREDTTEKGGVMHNGRTLNTYRLMDTASEETLDIQALGEGSDTGDKVLNKCMTGAYKYAIRQLLMISTGADPDATPSHQTEVVPPVAPAPPPAVKTVAAPATTATMHTFLNTLARQKGFSGVEEATVRLMETEWATVKSDEDKCRALNALLKTLPDEQKETK